MRDPTDGRKAESENAAADRIGRHPQPARMAIDDGMADRQAQAQARGLGREHWVKNALKESCVDARTGILDTGKHAALLI